MRVMLSCGEASGDLYAAALARELRRRDPSIEIVGLGGDRLKAAGAQLIADFSGLSVTGLTEAFRVIPRAYLTLRRLVADARRHRPDVFVAIDFPDFNFRLMAALKRLGIPVVYYISPQLWAWRPGRMRTMQKLVDRVLVIFPFEEPLYRRHGVDVEFVGHPLIDLVRPRESREAFLGARGLNPLAPTVALLPGSRRNELERIAPDMAAAVPLIRRRVPDAQFVVACAPHLDEALFAPFGRVAVPRPVLVYGATDDVLAAADVVVTASGTATVQAALHERPMVVVYRLSPLTYRLGKPFVKVETYSMVNLVAGTRVVPELIQDDFTPARVAEEVTGYLTNPQRHAQTSAALHDIGVKLGGSGASGRAADAVLAVALRSSRES